MRILLLNQTFYPDVVSSAQHAADLAAALTERGHTVTVVCSRRAYDTPSRQFTAFDFWRGVTIRRVASTALGKASLWRRAVDFATFLLSCLVRLIFLPRHDVVIAMTSPPLIGVLAALFARLKGGSLVSWTLDLNPDEAIAAGALRPDSIFARALSHLLRFSLMSSAEIVVLDRFMRDRLIRKGVPNARLTIVPPWAHSDVVSYDQRGRDRFRRTHKLDGKFVVMYSGNHSPCHPLDTLLGAAHELRSESGIVFVFAGGGAEFRKVVECARRQENIVCLPYQPLEELAASLSAADLHVAAMGNAFAGIVHPCKIYNVLSVGSPCLYIGPRPSHIGDLAARLPPDTISCADHGDIDRVVRLIGRFAGVGPRRSPPAMAAAERFTEASLIPRLVAVLEKAGEQPRKYLPAVEVIS